MGTSYVAFIKNGFWTHDAILEGFSYLLAREFRKFENKEAWQIELIDNWLIAARAGFSGCVPSYLDSFKTHDKVELLRKILVDTYHQLKTNPNFITALELNNNTSRSDWSETHLNLLAHLTGLTLKLIDGQIKSDASSPIDYWNVE